MDKQHGKRITMTQSNPSDENTHRFAPSNARKSTELSNAGS